MTTPEGDAKPKAKAAAEKRPTVPLRRAAMATADVAVLAATGAVAEFGAIGVLAGAAAAVGVPMAAKAGRKVRTRTKTWRAARASGGLSGSGGGLFGGGRSGSGSGLFGSGSGSTGTGGRRTGAAGGGGAGRSLRDLLSSGGGKSGSKPGSGGGLGSSGGGGSKSSKLGSIGGSGKDGGKPGSKSNRAGGFALVGGKLGLLDRMTGRNPSLRQERRHARAKAKDAVKLAEWAARRKWGRKRNDAALKKARDEAAKAKPGGVRSNLRGDTDTPPPAAPVPAPTSPGPLPVPVNNGNSTNNPVIEGAVMGDEAPSVAMRRLQDLAEQMSTVAMKHAPDGNLEVLAGYRQMPAVLNEILKALSYFHKSAASQGLHPAVVEYVEAMVKAQKATAVAAAAIAPAIEKLHKVELDYLRAGGSARWDRNINGTAAPRRGRGSAPAAETAAP
jgi:hypothetical protein